MGKKKEYGKKRTLEELLNDLDDSINFLAIHFNIKGYERDDLKQIMCLNIIQTYNKNKKYYSRRKLGYWFMRCKWILLNLNNDNEKRNPLAKSISVDNIFNNVTYTGGDN